VLPGITNVLSWNVTCCRPPQLVCYIPLYFIIVSVVIVIGINTPESLAIVFPVIIMFNIVLVLTKYVQTSLSLMDSLNTQNSTNDRILHPFNRLVPNKIR
jgi:hypothetical protein